MVREKQFAYNLIDFIDNSPSQFHATNEVKKADRKSVV